MRACGRAFVALLLSVMLSAPTAVAGPYEDCILQYMKDARTSAAAAEIRKACRDKTIPVACRTLKAPSLDEFLDASRPVNANVSDTALTAYWQANYASRRETELKKCLADCEASSWWERNFGQCKLG